MGIEKASKGRARQNGHRSLYLNNMSTTPLWRARRSFLVPACGIEGSVLYCKPMNTETFSVRLDRSAKIEASKARQEHRSQPTFLAAEAIFAYLDTNEWQVAGITKALSSLDRGKGIAHARVSEWVASWETRKERPDLHGAYDAPMVSGIHSRSSRLARAHRRT